MRLWSFFTNWGIFSAIRNLFSKKRRRVENPIGQSMMVGGSQEWERDRLRCYPWEDDPEGLSDRMDEIEDQLDEHSEAQTSDYENCDTDEIRQHIDKIEAIIEEYGLGGALAPLCEQIDVLKGQLDEIDAKVYEEYESAVQAEFDDYAYDTEVEWDFSNGYDPAIDNGYYEFKNDEEDEDDW